MTVDTKQMEKLKGKTVQTDEPDRNQRKAGNGSNTIDDRSIITTYENAVKLINKAVEGKRVSSSSEDDGLDTSDEIEKLEVDNLVLENDLRVRDGNDKVLQFIAENRPPVVVRKLEHLQRFDDSQR